MTLIISRANGHEYDDLYSSVRKDRSDVAIILLTSRTVSSARRLLTGYRSRMCEVGGQISKSQIHWDTLSKS